MAGLTSPRTAGLPQEQPVGLPQRRTAAGLTSPWTAALNEPRTTADLTSPRMTAGMTSEPRTAGLCLRRLTGLTGVWLMDWTTGWFWIGAGHSPDTGGSLPSSSVLWCLGGPPRAMVIGPDPEQGVEGGVVKSCTHGETAVLPCILYKWEISAGQSGEQFGDFHAAERREKGKQKNFQKTKQTRGKRSAEYIQLLVSYSVTRSWL